MKNTLQVINTVYGSNEIPVIQLLYDNGSSLIMDRHDIRQMDAVFIKIRNAIASGYVVTFEGFDR